MYYLLNDVFIFGQYQTNTQSNKKLKQLLKKLKTINCFHMNECLRRAIGGTGGGGKRGSVNELNSEPQINGRTHATCCMDELMHG